MLKKHKHNKHAFNGNVACGFPELLTVLVSGDKNPRGVGSITDGCEREDADLIDGEFF